MSDEGDGGGERWISDSSKRYRSEINGNGFKITILSESLTGLPTHSEVKCSYDSIRKHIKNIVPSHEYLLASTNQRDEFGLCQKESDRDEVLRQAKTAFASVWPKFVAARPNVALSYVTRSSVAGLFYIVLDGATISYNRSTAKYSVDGQVVSGWIGDGFMYNGVQDHITVADVVSDVVRDFETFLCDAKISMGDFVEEMLDAVEYPLHGSIAQTFHEHGLPVVHARYAASVGKKDTVILTIGTTRAAISFGSESSHDHPLCIRTRNPMPWMTEDVLGKRDFWRTLALRVLGKVPNVNRFGTVVSWRRMNGAADLTIRMIFASQGPEWDAAIEWDDESVPASPEY